MPSIQNTGTSTIAPTAQAAQPASPADPAAAQVAAAWSQAPAAQGPGPLAALAQQPLGRAWDPQAATGLKPRQAVAKELSIPIGNNLFPTGTYVDAGAGKPIFTGTISGQYGAHPLLGIPNNFDYLSPAGTAASFGSYVVYPGDPQVYYWGDAPPADVPSRAPLGLSAWGGTDAGSSTSVGGTDWLDPNGWTGWGGNHADAGLTPPPSNASGAPVHGYGLAPGQAALTEMVGLSYVQRLYTSIFGADLGNWVTYTNPDGSTVTRPEHWGEIQTLPEEVRSYDRNAYAYDSKTERWIPTAPTVLEKYLNWVGQGHAYLPSDLRRFDAAGGLGSAVGSGAHAVSDGVQCFQAAQHQLAKAQAGQGGYGEVLSYLDQAVAHANSATEAAAQASLAAVQCGAISSDQYQASLQTLQDCRALNADAGQRIRNAGPAFNAALQQGMSTSDAVNAVWQPIADALGQSGTKANGLLQSAQGGSASLPAGMKAEVDQQAQGALKAAATQASATSPSTWSVNPDVPAAWDALAQQDGPPKTPPAAAVVGLYFAAPEYTGAPDEPIIHDNVSTTLLGVVGYGLGAGALVNGLASATWQGLKTTVLPTNVGQAVAAAGSAIYSGISSVTSDRIVQALNGQTPSTTAPGLKDVPGMLMSAMTGTALAKIGPLFNIVNAEGKVIGQYTEALVATRGVTWAGAIEAAQLVLKGDASELVSLSAGVGGAYITQAGGLVAAAVNGPGNVATRFLGGLNVALPYIAPGAVITGIAKATNLVPADPVTDKAFNVNLQGVQTGK